MSRRDAANVLSNYKFESSNLFTVLFTVLIAKEYEQFYPLFTKSSTQNHQYKIKSGFTPLAVDAELVVEAIIILNKIERN